MVSVRAGRVSGPDRDAAVARAFSGDKAAESVRRHRAADQWARVISSLESVRAGGEPVSEAVVAAALLLRVSKSTVWAHLRRGAHEQGRVPRDQYALSEADRTDLYLAGGNVAAVVRERRRHGTPRATVRTLQRTVAREMNDMERAYVRSGWRMARDKGLSANCLTGSVTASGRPTTAARRHGRASGRTGRIAQVRRHVGMQVITDQIRIPIGG